MTNDTSVPAAYLDETFRTFRGYKRMADAALAQLDDAAFFRLLDQESNSVALIVKHVAGNLRSRWTDFLTTDGEKPDRDRDQEFLLAASDTREELMRYWERSWQTTLDTIQNLKPEEVLRTVTIRGTPHTVIEALSRSVTHAAYHVGQIIFLAKHLLGKDWKTLSIPRGRSKEYNATTPEDRKVTSPARS
jgi:uncharacterized damage-inducible protein DinB